MRQAERLGHIAGFAKIQATIGSFRGPPEMLPTIASPQRLLCTTRIVHCYEDAMCRWRPSYGTYLQLTKLGVQLLILSEERNEGKFGKFAHNYSHVMLGLHNEEKTVTGYMIHEVPTFSTNFPGWPSSSQEPGTRMYNTYISDWNCSPQGPGRRLYNSYIAPQLSSS
jgi:hypothetical protein